MSKEPKFCSAFITKIQKETPYARHFNLKVSDAEVKNSYQIPGQFTIVRVPDFKDGFFALTSHPEDKEWSLLVKGESPLTTHLLGLTFGNTIQVSEAQGKGFKLDLCQGKNIVLFGVGSGIAPLRASLLEMFKNRSQYKEITLFYGVRNQNEFAYHHEFEEWEKQGIKIIRTLSNKEDSSWTGLKGYVQHHINEFQPDSVALLCGMPEMVQEVREKLISLGLQKDHILTND